MKFNWVVKRIKRKSKKLGKKFALAIIRPIAPKKFKSIKFMELWHFFSRSELNHICRKGLALALDYLDKRAAIIVETGTSAWGTDSTRLWALYIESFGGRLHSVDIREEPRQTLGNLGANINLYVQDSVDFLNKFNTYEKSKIDLIYLDSFDINWDDPEPAMKHGLREFKSIEKYLKLNSIVVIDDTPDNLDWIPLTAHLEAKKMHLKYGELPGKGALVLAELRNSSEKYEILYHSYNLVFRKIS